MLFTMQSPIFRDAFQMELLSKSMGLDATVGKKDEKDIGVEQTDEGKIHIEADAQAIRWLFGLLDNIKAVNHGISDKDDLDRPPSTAPLLEALDLADKYDIPFYPAIMADALSTMVETGKYQAIMVYTMAYHLDRIGLARQAVRGMSGLPDPATWSLRTATIVTLPAWWALCGAYRDVGFHAGPGSLSARWGLVAAKLIFPEPVSQPLSSEEIVAAAE